MNKTAINFKTIGSQQLQRQGPLKEYASDTINYIEAYFDLDDSWRDSDRLYAAWFVDDNDKFTDIPLSGAVVIPQELLTIPGTLQMNLVAESYQTLEDGSRVVTYRNTTYPVDVLKTARSKV